MRSSHPLFAFAAVFVFAQVGCVADSDEEDLGEVENAVTNGRIEISSVGDPGPKLATWGYDIKQPGRARALKPALARELYGDIGMNLLRVAVWAAEGHPSPGAGAIRDGVYKDDLEAIANVKAVRPDAAIFASVKLVPGGPSFPGWVKEGGEVKAERYAQLLENYLAYMKSKGVTIDWLGVDNERRFNEGNITPAKFNTIVSDVKAWCRENGVKVPSFIAPEDYGPTEDIPWLQNLGQTGAGFQHVDAVGVHTYSKHRDAGYVDALQRLDGSSRGRPLWDSELHWNDHDEDNDVGFDDLRRGMLLAMDHFDRGFQSITWWAFQPRSRNTKAGHIMSELVSSTVGTRRLPTDDGDGGADAIGKLSTRAFKKSAKELTLWVANFDNRDRKDLRTEVKNHEVASATFVSWSSSSSKEGRSGTAKVVAKNKTMFSMSYPSNTITRVTILLK